MTLPMDSSEATPFIQSELSKICARIGWKVSVQDFDKYPDFSRQGVYYVKIGYSMYSEEHKQFVVFGERVEQINLYLITDVRHYRGVLQHLVFETVNHLIRSKTDE